MYTPILSSISIHSSPYTSFLSYIEGFYSFKYIYLYYFIENRAMIDALLFIFSIGLSRLSLPTAPPSLIKVIAVTGGPCGGKSTVMEELKRVLTDDGKIDVYVVPEMPTLLMAGGARYPGMDAGRELLDYEVALIRAQMSLEQAFRDIARSTGRLSVLLCDRGSVDVKAYVPLQLWNSMLAALDTTDKILLSRYDGVCHMVTAAEGAEEYYGSSTNAMRKETAEQARALEHRTRAVWAEHARRVIVDNPEEGGFETKTASAVQRILALLSAD